VSKNALRLAPSNEKTDRNGVLDQAGECRPSRHNRSLADVTALVLLIQLDDALMSPLTVGFAVLIAASALWSRADEITRTTLLSMDGYTSLVVIALFSHGALDRPYRHFHYLVGLALLGLILSYQANRTQALARISGRS
jgi:serine/threonine-protein kinase